MKQRKKQTAKYSIGDRVQSRTACYYMGIPGVITGARKTSEGLKYEIKLEIGKIIYLPELGIEPA